MRVGIDIVKMSRFANKELLAKRILSPEEYAIYEGRSDKVSFVSGRFAAKEAFIKALGGQFSEIAFHHISILYNEFGAPVIHFQGQTYPVSIAHDGEYATAICVFID